MTPMFKRLEVNVLTKWTEIRHRIGEYEKLLGTEWKELCYIVLKKCVELCWGEWNGRLIEKWLVEKWNKTSWGWGKYNVIAAKMRRDIVQYNVPREKQLQKTIKSSKEQLNKNTY